MKRYYVYLVECADGSVYVGITNDVDRRVAEHNLGLDENCYTFERRPVTVIHVSEFAHVDEAIACEKRIKRWSRAKKLALARGDWHQIHELARCRNETASDQTPG